MFDPAFDWFMAAILVVLAVVFFMGKGQGILDLFSGRVRNQKKMDEETNLKYQKGVAVFLLVLGIGEVFMALFPGAIMGVISIVIAIVALIGIMIFMKKLL